MEKNGMTIQEFEAFYPKVHRRTLQRELAGLIESGRGCGASEVGGE